MGSEVVTLCGSLSRYPVPLGQEMHNAGYRELGLPFTYVPFACGDLKAALDAMRALGIRGFGISMPFKLQVMPLLDAIDPLAKKIGAVNTVVNDEGTLTGHNTDWVGAARALGERFPDLNRVSVLVLGAGGAARAVGYGLKEHGAEVTLSNRTDARGRQLADEIGVAYCPWSERRARQDQALVNASSAGMTDEQAVSPMTDEGLRAGMTVMDIVYKPLHTELLRLAEARGAATIHGGRMLLHQAARQFELYTGRDAPIDAMNAALCREIG